MVSNVSISYQLQRLMRNALFTVLSDPAWTSCPRESVAERSSLQHEAGLGYRDLYLDPQHAVRGLRKVACRLVPISGLCGFLSNALAEADLISFSLAMYLLKIPSVGALDVS